MSAPVSVSDAIKPRYTRQPGAPPRYTTVQTTSRAPYIYGYIAVDHPAQLTRAMEHWMFKFQHARPSISYDDIDHRKARWSRLDTGE